MYVRRLISVWLGRKWWIIAMPLIVLLLLGVRDSRWLIVAMMYIMIVVPGVMAIVYFNFALSPEMAVRVLRQKVTPYPEGFTLTYLPIEDSHFAPEPERIRYADIAEISDTGQNLEIRLKRSAYTLIIIPTSAAESTAILESWHNFC